MMCLYFQNPCNSNRDLIKQAENLFVSFSKSKLTLPQCFQILENSRNELVLFETVKMMKNILVYEWRGLNEEDKLLLRQKLLDYVINNQQLHSSGKDESHLWKSRMFKISLF
jgi:Importin-beta N-terminal domain